MLPVEQMDLPHSLLCTVHCRQFNLIDKLGPGIITQPNMPSQHGPKWEIDFDGGPMWEAMREDDRIERPGRISFIRNELVLLKVVSQGKKRNATE